MFLKCSANNKAETVLELFLDAVKRDGEFGLWGYEYIMVLKMLVCAIQWCRLEERRGAASLQGHQHNQRTERLWRDVFRCASHLYFYTFYSMELSGILDTDNSVHLFTLNLVFQPRINQTLYQFTEAFNHQNVRTEKKLVVIPNVAYHMMQPENPLSNGKSYDFEY